MSFDAFWATYPRRIAKLAAKRKYDAALKLATSDEILAGAQAYARVTATVEMQFIKHPATWLHGGCWEDDMSAIVGLAPKPSNMFDDLAEFYDAQSQREAIGSQEPGPALLSLPGISRH